MNDCVSLSFTTYSRSLRRAGDAPDPHAPRIFAGGISLLQRISPVIPRANTPIGAKYTYNRSPSVTGVSEAKLFFRCLGPDGTMFAIWRCHRTFPVAKSIAYTIHRCGTLASYSKVPA